MKIAGNLDLCGPSLVEGWLYSDDLGEPLRLQIYVDKKLVGECVADRFRQDLLDAGHGDGRCGFSFQVPDNIAVIDFASTQVRLLGTPLYLLPNDYTRIGAVSEQPEAEETEEDTATEAMSYASAPPGVKSQQPRRGEGRPSFASTHLAREIKADSGALCPT